MTGRTVEDQTVFAAVDLGLIPKLKPVPLSLAHMLAPKAPVESLNEAKYPPVAFMEPSELILSKKDQ